MNYTDPSHFPAVGCYQNVAFADYCKVDAVSSTFLKALAIGPTAGHAKFKMDHMEETDDMAKGTACHTFELEPQRFEREYRLAKGCECIIKSGNKEGAACLAKTAQLTNQGWLCGRHNAGTTPVEGVKSITPEFLAILENAHREMWRVAPDNLDGSEKELTLIWEESRFGRLCKARFDLFREDANLITDIKKVQCASTEAFSGDVSKRRYDVQDVWYRRAAQACLDEHGIYRLQFLCTELNDGKVANGAHLLEITDQESLAAAENTVNQTLEVYHNCMTTGVWPLYPAGCSQVSLRKWLIRKEMAA